METAAVQTGDRALFGSHDEAWAHFLRRRAPVPSLLDRLSDDPAATVTVWLTPAAEHLRPALAAVRDDLDAIPFLRRVPDHFLHLTLAASTHARAEAAGELAGLEPFAARLVGVGSFPEAVVAEVEGDGAREAAHRLGTPLDTFVPHVSLAYSWEPGPVAPVREAVLPWRGRALGEQLVDEILLCEVPASRTTFLQPWRVLERVRLG